MTDTLVRLRPDIRKAWTDALRSDRFTQGFGALLDDEGGNCCLGVLGCVLADQFPDVLEETGWNYNAEFGTFYNEVFAEHPEEYDPNDHECENATEIPHEIAYRIGLLTGNGTNPSDRSVTLVELNDSRQWGFEQIAAYIDEWY